MCSTFDVDLEISGGVAHPGLADVAVDLIQAGPETLREPGNTTVRLPNGPHVSQVRLLPPVQPPSARDSGFVDDTTEFAPRG